MALGAVSFAAGTADVTGANYTWRRQLTGGTVTFGSTVNVGILTLSSGTATFTNNYTTSTLSIGTGTLNIAAGKIFTLNQALSVAGATLGGAGLLRGMAR